MNQLEQTIDRIGDFNPQLFRELKERLTARNIALTTIGSLGIQALVCLNYFSQIPTPTWRSESRDLSQIPEYQHPNINGLNGNPENLYEVASRYCMGDWNPQSGNCGLAPDRVNYLIDWHLWWVDVYTALGLIISMALILGLVYTLVADLSQEEKRGTLNFIRLSPQPPQVIFSGKLLGVPILVYIGFVLTLPFLIWAGINSGGSLGLLLSTELAIAAMSLVWASGAILYCLIGGFQAILTTLGIAYLAYLPLEKVIDYTRKTLLNLNQLNTDRSWFGLPIFNHIMLLDLLIIISCSIVCYHFWQVISRRYLNPTATIITKPQSYLITATFQVWLLGFAWSASGSSYRSMYLIQWLTIINFMAIAGLVTLLLPSKQAMQDWSRYRRQTVTASGNLKPKNLWHDLLIDEKSNALLAVLINLTMAVGMWSILTVVLKTFDAPGVWTRFCGCLCIAACLILIYTAMIHNIQFYRLKRRQVWMAGMVAVSVIGPVAIAYALSGNRPPQGIAAIVLLFSPLMAAGTNSLSGMTMFAAFAAQVGILGGLSFNLHRQIQISGQSETKREIQC
jgi:hypothetical protein